MRPKVMPMVTNAWTKIDLALRTAFYPFTQETAGTNADACLNNLEPFVQRGDLRIVGHLEASLLVFREHELPNCPNSNRKTADNQEEVEHARACHEHGCSPERHIDRCLTQVWPDQDKAHGQCHDHSGRKKAGKRLHVFTPRSNERRKGDDRGDLCELRRLDQEAA